MTPVLQQPEIPIRRDDDEDYSEAPEQWADAEIKVRGPSAIHF